MQSFDEYMSAWWEEYVSNHQECPQSIMEDWVSDNGTTDEYLAPGQTPFDWLLARSPGDVYTAFFGSDARIDLLVDMPDTEELLRGMFLQATSWVYGRAGEYPSFAETFVESMAGEAFQYGHPVGFFRDLAYGGCSSGLVGTLIYNSDCKRIYIDHMDDMEEYKNQLEEEMEAIPNRNRLPHGTFMCWLCYEELAHHIASTLWPEEF